MPAGSENKQTLQMEISSFWTPFSAADFNSVSVLYFDDEYCTRSQVTLNILTNEIAYAELPNDNVVLTAEKKLQGVM